MNLQPQSESAFTPRTGEEAPAAPRLSLLSLAALLAGLLSVVAMVSPLLWPVAGVALVCCVLVKIYLSHHRGELAGERLATIGLAVALMFVTAGPARYALRQWRISEQSAEIGREWLQYLVRNEPESYNAYESMRPVAMRRPLSPQLELLYAADNNEAQAYFYFLNSPLIKALGLLPRSVPVTLDHQPNEPSEAGQDGGVVMLPRPVQVRHYQTERIESSQDGSDVIRDLFAVTWHDEQDKPHSLLVRLEIERRTDPTVVGGLWRVMSYDLVKAK